MKRLTFDELRQGDFVLVNFSCKPGSYGFFERIEKVDGVYRLVIKTLDEVDPLHLREYSYPTKDIQSVMRSEKQAH